MHAGQCSGATGDGYSFVFEDAKTAVASAWGIVRAIEADTWPEDAHLRVRVGVHLGRVDQAGDVFSGVTIHEAARITALAGTSQVLVTELARPLAQSLPAGTELVDLGLHVVRDFPDPVRLFRLDELGAGSKSAPARDAHRAQLAPMVGRDDVVDQLREALSSGRLVTIVGPGGIGKTRLALELMRTHPGDVVMADLAEIERNDEVAALLIDLFRVGGSGPNGGLADLVGSKAVLVVLDNCEHVIGGVSQVCNELLEQCPRVRLLATSRQFLDVAGERPWILGPLDTDAAAALFTTRAALSLGVNRAPMLDRRLVRKVCDRLDNIPLAIELAAARLRVLGIDDLDRRLADQMTILTDPRQSGGPRRRTMQATIDWSVDLLTPAERELFRRLSVFRGGARLDAIVSVAAEADELQLLDILEELITRSLVVRDDNVGRPRYRLLEPIRQFADGLLGSDTRRELKDRHADWMQRSIPLLAREMLVLGDARVAITAESSNVVAAVEHLVERHRLEPALLVVGALGYFWFSERPAEGWRLTSRVLDACDGTEPPALRSGALLTAGQLLQLQLRLSESRDALTEAVALVEGECSSSVLGWALFQLGRTEAMADRTVDAWKCFERAQPVFRLAGDHMGSGWTQLWRGNLCEDPDEKAAITAELVEFAREKHLLHVLAGALGTLAAPQAFRRGRSGSWACRARRGGSFVRATW